MNRIDELIKRLCHNGVPYIKLQEIAEIGTGNSDRKDAVENGDYPFYVRSKDILRIDKYEYDETAIIIPGEGGIGEIFHYVEGKYALHQRAYRIHIIDNKLNTKYLYYYMSSMFKKFIMKKAVSATVTSIRKPMIEQFPVPVPPLDVQCKIVHILDDFTLLSAELSAELKARREQFNYYRSKLFEKYPSDFVELDSIGDVTKLAGFEFTKYVKYSQEGNIIALRGLNVKDGMLVLNDIKYIDNSDFSKLERSKLYKNDLLYTYVGTVGQVGLVDQNNKYYLAPNVARIRINNSKVLPKFVMYFLQTPEFKVNQLDKLTGASSMKNITMTNIRKFKIPLPSIEEQERIVNILDKFDKYCNNISEGLPAEIEARQKQYEYYRDKLLTFKELKSK